MDTAILRKCELLMENREVFNRVCAFEGNMTVLACAGVFTAKNMKADEAHVKACKALLKKNVGIFSDFRGTGMEMIVAQMALSDDPEGFLKKSFRIHGLLRKEFWSSSYLPMVAMSIAQLADEEEYEQIVSRTKTLYKRMKQEHPFLTSEEDSPFCALLALSDRSDDELIAETETCYNDLKKTFRSRNALQSLSHVLTLCEGAAEEKCEKTRALYAALKAAGHPYSVEYELPTLGILAVEAEDQRTLVQNMLEADAWLSKQKGFGIFSDVSRKHRLMYAGLMCQTGSSHTMQTAAIGSTIGNLIAEQAAMCAMMAATAAAAASSSSSST